MKKHSFVFLIIILFMMFLNTFSVNAASFSMSASTRQVSPNGSFTVKVGGDCIGRVNLTVSNGVLSTNSVWVEQGYVSVKVTALSSGTVTVTARPAEGFSDSDANIYNPGSRSVSVNIASSNSGSSSTKPSTNNPVKKKSSNNNLSALTVSAGELSPKFSDSNKEYSLSLPASVDSLTIKATAEDSKATVEGNGKVNVKPGNNTIKITVTAENGSKKVYTIKVYVDEAPQVYFNYKNEKIGVVRNYEGVSIPKDFNRLEYTIDKKKMDIFTNKNITIIYGLADDKSKNFYLFDKEKNELVNKFVPLTIGNRDIYVIDSDINRKNMKRSSALINDKEVSCYDFENVEDNYCLLNVINEEGNTVEYLYESTENTIQLYPAFLSICDDSNDLEDIIIYGLCGLLAFLFSILTLVFIFKKGGKNEKTK
ncbi:MAG: cadherin-like beta sandwich domain-containing protein [Bacilli bacterium]|nr:cadherin-like beta sandwich domain-containing protein [Bacilli bacterium]